MHNAAIDARVAEHLSQTYGVRAESVVVRGVADAGLLERMNPDLPYLWAEVEHAIEVDLARTVEDVLMRRIPLGLRGRDQGLDVAARVAQRMARHLHWSETERTRQVEAYRATIESTRRFRGAAPPAQAAGG
jgi:glycerol-3-phosphate dehydrogenase